MSQHLGVFLCLVLFFLACGRSRRNEVTSMPGGGEAGSGASVDCSTDDPCLRGYFDEAEGRCLTSPRSGACDDGDACTTGDACNEGVCLGTARDCDDGLGCTVDRCAAELGCVHQMDPEVCDDGDRCTVDGCNARGECTNEPSSGNVCGGADCTAKSVCVEGACVEQPVDASGVCYPVTIDFGDVFVGMTRERELELEATAGRFNVKSVETDHPEIGVDPPTLPQVVEEGESISIQLSWTPTAEGTLDAQALVHTDSVTWYVDLTGRAMPQPDCNDDDPCTTDTLDTNKGACAHEVAVGATCDDGDACTVGDACDAGGACAAGDYLECPEGQVCKTGACAERLCLDPANLAPVCAEVLAPLGDGCICQLAYQALSAERQKELSDMLAQDGYAQRIIATNLMIQIVMAGWRLRLRDTPQQKQVDRVLELFARWDMDAPFVGPHGEVAIDTSAAVAGLFRDFQTVVKAPHLLELTNRLEMNGFDGTLTNYRTIGLANSDVSIIVEISSAADQAELQATVATINAALADPQLVLTRLDRISLGF